MRGYTALKRVILMVLIICLSVTNRNAQAQFCPPGQYPVVGQGWNYCAPTPGSRENSVASTPVVPVWRSRWQSIATDTPRGVLGTSVAQDTPAQAEKEAMKDCSAKGGQMCKIQVTNGNGCVAMVVGDKVMNTNSGATKDEAEAKGIQMCSKDDVNCRVYYSSCSLPERIR